jgi:hypothetical protein
MTNTEGRGEEPAYLAYLLRLWQVRSDKEATWRASLVSPGSDEPRGFASLDDLFAFLRRQTGVQSCPGDPEARARP